MTSKQQVRQHRDITVSRKCELHLNYHFMGQKHGRNIFIYINVDEAIKPETTLPDTDDR